MLFRRLGIFVNGFTLEAATAVGTSDDLGELDLFDVLASLVDKSLVLAEPAGDALRYRMLESTRAYAREKLGAAAESQERSLCHLRHLRNRFVDERERLNRTGRKEPIEKPDPNSASLISRNPSPENCAEESAESCQRRLRHSKI